MPYLTTKEFAEKWNISQAQVRKYCIQGRIENAILKDGSWWIPSDTPKPSRKEPDPTPIPEYAQKLLKERKRRGPHPFYDFIQTNLCYSSNRLASNRLTLKQVQEIYATNKVSPSFEALTINDLIETINHFMCFDHVLETSPSRITQEYIQSLHHLLMYGTYGDRRDKYRPGEYRKSTYSWKDMKSPAPRAISSQMSKLICEYEHISSPTLEDLLSFHVGFESIHPFEDGNGRIGRLLLLKECIRHNIPLFIIEDKQRATYLKGIRNWEYDRIPLLRTCVDAQKRYSREMETLALIEEHRKRLARARGIEE